MFAGLLPFDPERPAETLLPERLARRLVELPDGKAQRAGNSLWLPASALQSSIPRDDAQWHRDPHDGTLVAFWGRLDNRDALAERWGQHLKSAGTTDADRIAAGWRRDGEALVDCLVGEFGFAVVAPVTRRVMLARDPLGVRPLSYRITADGLWVGSSLPLLRALVREPAAPDDDWIRRFLMHQSQHPTRTAYPDIVRLAPAHTLSIADGAAPVLRRWFAWRDDPPDARQRDEHWVELYRDALDTAVRCRWDGDAPVATENSAGIDSAGVTAMLARQVPDVAHRLISVGLAPFDAESLDILGLSRSLGIHHNHVLTRLSANPSTADLRNTLRVLGHPEENSSGTGMAPLHEVCRRLGVRHLFSGFGGDEAGSHPAPQLRRELLDQGHYRALFDILPGALPARALRLARAAWTRTPTMQPAVFDRGVGAGNAAGPVALLAGFLARAEVDRLGIEAEVRAQQWAKADCRTVNAAVIGPGLASPNVASRTESGTLVAATRGLEYHWPLLDVRLIQQYLSTPGIEKVGPRGIGRYLHRRAIDPLVPARIAWRTKKDTGQQASLGRMRSVAQELAGARARRLQAELHPRLQALVALPTLRDFTARALAGSLNVHQALTFERYTVALDGVDLWLAGLDDGSLYDLA